MSDIQPPEQDVPIDSSDDIGFDQQRQEAIAAHEAKSTASGRGFLGNSLPRLAVIGVGAVVVVLLGAFLVLQFIRTSRTKPLDYEPYPGSKLVSTANGSSSDVHAYSTTDSVQQVIAFYTQRLGCTDRSSDGKGCAIEPQDKKQGRCIVDNSQDDLTQRLMISVSDVGGGATVIQIQRDWGGS